MICSPYERQRKIKLSHIGGVTMPNKRRLNTERIIQIVEEYKAGKASAASLAQRNKVHELTVLEWVKAYEAEGTEAFEPHEGNRTYSAEKKLAAVRAYLAGEGSLREIAQRYKLRSKTQLESWIKVYHAHGDFNSVKISGGGSYMKQGRDTTQEERVQIARECIASGKNYGEIALKYQVSYQQVPQLDAAVRGDGRGGLGGSAREAEERPSAADGVGEGANRN